MGVKVSGFLGLILLVADIRAIANISQSRTTTGKKFSGWYSSCLSQ